MHFYLLNEAQNTTFGNLQVIKWLILGYDDSVGNREFHHPRLEKINLPSQQVTGASAIRLFQENCPTKQNTNSLQTI